jgi:hypothetical protein
MKSIMTVSIIEFRSMLELIIKTVSKKAEWSIMH